MTNTRPTLSIIVREKGKYTAEDLCTTVATAVVWFIDEVDSNFTHAKHEVALKEWQSTGSHLEIRCANEDQWWQFLTAPGMTESYGNIHFHVIPPVPANQIPDIVKECSEEFTNILPEKDMSMLDSMDMNLPMLSVNIKRSPKETLRDYMTHAISASIINYLGNDMSDQTEPWSNSNFSLMVSLVDNLEFVTLPRMVMRTKGASEPNIQGFWIEDKANKSVTPENE